VSSCCGRDGVGTGRYAVKRRLIIVLCYLTIIVPLVTSCTTKTPPKVSHYCTPQSNKAQDSKWKMFIADLPSPAHILCQLLGFPPTGKYPNHYTHYRDCHRSNRTNDSSCVPRLFCTLGQAVWAIFRFFLSQWPTAICTSSVCHSASPSMISPGMNATSIVLRLTLSICLLVCAIPSVSCNRPLCQSFSGGEEAS
jgi:hypothetical protein